MPVLSLSELAQKYQLDPTKPFFPVNSLRLFYFIFNDYYTSGSQETQQLIEKVVPQIEAIFEARTQHRSNTSAATVQSDWEAVETPLAQLLATVDTPAIRDLFSQVFTYLNPLQDEFFVTNYQEIISQEKLSVSHLTLLLRIRAMDSIAFSTILAEIWRRHLDQGGTGAEAKVAVSLESLHHHFSLAYQLNDLVDTIVFARDDLDAGNFSPFKVIQKIAPDGVQAKELITNIIEELMTQTKLFPFPPELQTQVEVFYKELVGVIKR